jgi:thymidine kinase
VEITGVKTGWLEVICGPMFSGKSEELMRRLRRARIARKGVQVFKPAIDTRYSMLEIVSHSDLRMESEPVNSPHEILAKVHSRTQVVGIDEVNLLGEDVIEVAENLADSGRQVILAGLDTDYRGRPFAPMPNLLARAEYIMKTLAVCVRCGAPAKHTQRLVAEKNLIVVGAAEAYEARCRACFEPDAPLQPALDFSQPRP